MPIDPEFPGNHQVIGRHNHADGKHYHFVWGPGSPSDASSNEEVEQLMLLEMRSLSLSVYMVLWLQLIGIRVLLME
jgi:hypothetical protein